MIDATPGFTPSVSTPPARWTPVLCLAAAALALALYQGVVRFDFSILDDNFYVTENRQILAGFTWANLKAVFTPTPGLYWSPVTLLSLMLDARLFGFWAGGFHVVNALWHCANVVLFFCLVLRLSGSRLAAFLAAGLLAAHPAHVEAVAWITARKDVLSTFLGLCAIHLYIGWTRRPTHGRNALFHVMFLLCLMAKPMFVTLAGLLLLLDWWPLGRLGALNGAGRALPEPRLFVQRLREKALLLALGVFATFMTLHSHFAGILDRLDPGPGLKLANAVVSYAKYLGLLIWPHDQATIYPFPESVPAAQVILSGLLLTALTGLFLWQRRARPYLLVGWLWFLAALTPVIMPPRVGLHVEYADRWSYVPFLGLYLALGCLAGELAGRAREGWPRLAASAALAVLPLAALIPVQQRQLATWRTPFSIAEQALRVTRGNYLLLNNYGILKGQAGDKQAAEVAFLGVLDIYPDYGPALYNLGMLRISQNRYAEALPPLLKGVEAEQRHGAKLYETSCSVALCLTLMGCGAEAPHYYALAIREDPRRPRAYNDWGNLARDTGDRELARELYGLALKADPRFDLARRNLAKLGASRRP